MCAMENEMKEWLDSFYSQQMQIWCEDPETSIEKIAGGVIGKSFVTYGILMKQAGRDVMSVRHRYSEFEALRVSLRDRYGPQGIVVPFLPPKSSVSNMISSNLKQTFIKERTLGLTLFCESIAASPWLRNDKMWKEFMKPKLTETISINESDQDNIGESKLIACLHQLQDVPNMKDMLQLVEDLKSEISLVEKFVKIVLDKVRTVQSSERAYFVAQEGLVESISQWVQAENNSSSNAGGGGVQYLAGNIKTTAAATDIDSNSSVLMHDYDHGMQSITSLAGMLTVKCAGGENFPVYTGLSLAVMLEQELAMIESLKELLRLHDEMAHGVESQTARLAKTENQLLQLQQQAESSSNSPISSSSSGGGVSRIMSSTRRLLPGNSSSSSSNSSSSSSSGSSNTILNNIAKLEQLATEQRVVLGERQVCISAFYKGFVYFTLPGCARQRAASLRKCCGFMTAAHLTASYALQKSCLQFFNELSLSPSSVIAENNRMLGLLKIPALHHIPAIQLSGEEETTNFTMSSTSEEEEARINSIAGLFERAIQIGGRKQPSSTATLSNDNTSSSLMAEEEGDDCEGGGAVSKPHSSVFSRNSTYSGGGNNSTPSVSAVATAASRTPSPVPSVTSRPVSPVPLATPQVTSRPVSPVPTLSVSSVELLPTTNSVTQPVRPMTVKSKSLLADLTGSSNSGNGSVWD